MLIDFNPTAIGRPLYSIYYLDNLALKAGCQEVDDSIVEHPSFNELVKAKAIILKLTQAEPEAPSEEVKKTRKKPPLSVDP